jgi:small subunit ribosomal protein S1
MGDSLRRFDGNETDSELEQDLDECVIERVFDNATVFHQNDLVEGTVRQIDSDGVVVDIGYKSEGIIRLDEWRDDGNDIPLPTIGDKIQVLIESEEDNRGLIKLSFRKARQQKAWEEFLPRHKEEDVVSGVVRREIKGGLLVDIGVTAFLPASEVNIRRPTSLSDYVGKTIECRILLIDANRRKIIVSRRRTFPTGTPMSPFYPIERLVPGQICKGIVKNIAEFGAFVDLGGIDGLLHITDMSWGRVTNPHDFVKIDQELEVFIIAVDRQKVKVSLGLKQKTPDPWQNIEQKYPVGSRHRAKVVALMPYGAFVELDRAVVGLVHVSEMSGSQPIHHPNECVNVGQEIEVQVLKIDREKHEMSLGLKQCRESSANP